LLFEPSLTNRKALKRDLRARYGWRTRFDCFSPTDVFTKNKKIPDKATVAFFRIASMYDLEAARKLGGIRERIPMIAISDGDAQGENNKGYALECCRCGTCRYYLLRPIEGDKLDKALKICAEWDAKTRGNYGYGM
jgi:hypothetical protein